MAAVEISKVVVVVINVLFMIFGVALIALGIVFKVNWEDVRDAFVDESEKVDMNIQYAGDVLSYSAIVFGAFIVALSLIGCVGAWCQVRVLLTLYAIVVLLLLIGEVAIVILVVGFGSDSRDKIADGLRDSLKNYYENSTTDASKAYTVLFDTLKCCGIEDYTTDFTTDLTGIPFYEAPFRNLVRYKLVIPITCCRDLDYDGTLTAALFDKHRQCLVTPTDQNAYVVGCLDAIENKIEDTKRIIIGVGAALFIIQVMVIVMAFFLCSRKED